MTKTWCVDRRLFSESISQNVYEKLNTKTQKLVKILKEKCDIRDRTESQIFTK